MCLSRPILPLALAALLVPAFAGAAVRVAFTVTQATNICNVDDSESVLQGDPDLTYRMGIFDSNSSSILSACASGCVDDGNPSTADARTHDNCAEVSTCGTWNFSNYTLSKYIQGRSGAYLYFGLWDVDVDANDSMGDHWVFRTGPFSGNSNNNNISPYHAGNPISSVCGESVEGGGWASNFRLYYSVDFTDDTPPLVPTPEHWDNDAPSPVSTDDLLRFRLGAAQDPDSGIDANYWTLEDLTMGTIVFDAVPAPADHDLTICPSGCDATYTPLNGHDYRFRAGARNGDYPTISNAVTTWSAWVDVSVALLAAGDPVAAPLSLAPPTPNPGPGPAMFRFSLPRDGDMRLSVFDVQGREVASPRSGRLDAGSHQLMWDGRDRSGRPVAAGVYVVRLEFEGEAVSRTLVVTD